MAYHAAYPSLGFDAYNANGSNPTIFQNGIAGTNTITNDSGQPFDFTSIGLAALYNNRLDGDHGGDVLFTFYHTNGSVNSVTVTVDDQPGLQTFSFNELALTKVVFQSLTTYTERVQFDLVGVQLSPVPLPAAVPLFAGGLGMIGLLAWRGKRKQA
jgi:hypothetical protein